MQHVVEICSNCETVSKCRRRDFSEQAWSVLVLWHEVQEEAVDQPICDHCYGELREVLIDRSDEIEMVIKNGYPIGRPSHDGSTHETPSKSAGRAGGRAKVRKVS